MKVNELRIGNIVCVDNEPYHPHLKDVLMRVVSIEHRHDLPEYSVSLERVVRDNSDVNVNYSQLIRFIKPVRLTEDILLKCGFVAKTKTDDFYKDGIAIASSYMTCKTEERSGFYLNLGNDNCPLNISINHVHELQNLYFALTGEELKVEL